MTNKVGSRNREDNPGKGWLVDPLLRSEIFVPWMVERLPRGVWKENSLTADGSPGQFVQRATDTQSWGYAIKTCPDWTITTGCHLPVASINDHAVKVTLPPVMWAGTGWGLGHTRPSAKSWLSFQKFLQEKHLAGGHEGCGRPIKFL